MTHDPLCPGWFDTLDGQMECDACDLIAKVREDERERAGIEQTAPSWKYPFTTAVTVRQPTSVDGQSVILASDCEKQIAEAGRDMLAKCIAAIDARIRPTLHPLENAGIGEALAALRALKDKP